MSKIGRLPFLMTHWFSFTFSLIVHYLTHFIRSIFFLLDSCLHANMDYPSANLNICMIKESARECQTECQNHATCTRFAYITNAYNGQHGTGIRKCCFLKSTATEDLISMDDVVAGPKTCKKTPKTQSKFS